jgi:hypothetical protein
VNLRRERTDFSDFPGSIGADEPLIAVNRFGFSSILPTEGRLSTPGALVRGPATDENRARPSILEQAR